MPTLLMVLGYVIQNGPQIVKLIQAIGPVYDAAKPLISRLMDQGVPDDKAVATAFKMIAVHKMSVEEEQMWFDKAKGEIG